MGRLRRPVENWLGRHRNATSFWLHMLGIPACFVVAPILLFWRRWALAGAFFLAGYALQFIGHLIEGNRSGEEMLVRRQIQRLKSHRGPRAMAAAWRAAKAGPAVRSDGTLFRKPSPKKAIKAIFIKLVQDFRRRVSS